ncbi:sigma-54-dependent Fis family transcriptional regulator [Solidesulfovibrio alcoholivorans]|uniref:sigma-54-dependent Fis family transcriptional regulator n=1 Tax=Solidesulfovibrio alcoholivorans TaxID=81406 RepID=UPI0006933090|nr:sigma-54-dependent Fis family transcriptional regulator [Solidesulfovibrio alcoholivorans]
MRESTGHLLDPKRQLVTTEQAWDRLVAVQYIDKSLLRQEIALSWQRCLSSNVNPHTSKNENVEKDYLDLENKRYLLEVALPHMQQLYTFVKGKDFIVMLAAADGTLLSVFGDKKMYSAGEALNVVAGASCLESVLGTTSPGICLARKVPLQVFRQEHYCRLYHTWCCSAVPLFNSQGELIGTLDLSNRDKDVHPASLLDLVKMTASSIQAEYNYRILQDDFKKSYYYFNMVVDNMPEALIFFDRDDKISHLNRNATKLLGTSAEQLVGKQAKAVFSNYDGIKQELATGRHWKELRFKTRSGLVGIEAYLKPLTSEYMEPLGIVCTLKEDNKPKPLHNTAKYTFDDFVHASEHMDALIRTAKRIAAMDGSVLIQGESGTGKEILAQAIHNASIRRNAPFIAVNCAALPQELIQSELFGYEEGTFTGAKRGGKTGKFEMGNGGTIFLDEIGDMPLNAQANLLRVLQEKSIVRVGGAHPIHLDIRVIAATNKTLSREIEAGRFRLDLFYRLAVMNLSIPPLRERKDDVMPLVKHFVRKHQQMRKDIAFSPPVKSLLQTYDWPGNVRELENVIVNVLTRITQQTVTTDDLPEYFNTDSNQETDILLLKDTELTTISSALVKCNNNITKTARLLGVSRATIYRKLKIYNATDCK